MTKGRVLAPEPELGEVIEKWGGLDSKIRAEIMAIVRRPAL